MYWKEFRRKLQRPNRVISSGGTEKNKTLKIIGVSAEI
jgi:hypothetical protein